MPLNVYGQRTVAEFQAAIEPWMVGYEHNSFTYVARKQDNAFVIAQAALWLNSTESKTPFRAFETKNLCAEHFKLSDVGKTAQQYITNLHEGKVITPRGERLFPSEHSNHHVARYEPFHPSALQSQSRVNVLQLKGIDQILDNGPSILDWELRGADTPYDTVQELFADYALGGLFTDKITVEVIATSVMGFDGDVSKIEGEIAKIVIRLANTLDVSNAAVGFREITPGKVNRGKIRGPQFSWSKTDFAQIGTFELKVARAAILHCYAMYNNVAQTHWYITDPTTSQNPRRVMFDSFDTGLGILREFLSRSNVRGQDARDLEVGVAWLFWMLGFNPVQLGLTSRTQDFADLLLVTPNGHASIVQCTTGLLRADNKLPKLVARHSTVRARLDQSNNRHVKLLPIMVSTLTKAELQADLEQAEKLGVGVLSREDLDQLVNRTTLTGNADNGSILPKKQSRD
jgi:hypothetical protein